MCLKDVVQIGYAFFCVIINMFGCDDMKTALVLEGGAMRGMYTAGVLDALLERNISVDAVIGVSAGALFGVNYITKQKGRSLRYNKKYLGDKDYFSFSSFFKTGNVMNEEFCFKKLVYELDPIDFQAFQRSKVKFYVTVTNIETGKAEYKLIDDLKQDMEYLRASGSMPVVSKIVKIDKKKYLDGGIADSIPVLAAKRLGYDRVVVVLTRPEGYCKKKSTLLPYYACYRDYPKFIDAARNRPNVYNNTLKKISKLEKEGSIFVIRPSTLVKVKHLEMDIQKVEAIYNLGMHDTLEKMNDLKKFLNS